MIQFSSVPGQGIEDALKRASPDQMNAAIRNGMEFAGRVVASQAKNNNGARPGPFVQTGRLRSSIGHVVSADGMSVAIGTNVSYAPRLELGFQGVEKVKAHTRKITKAWGKVIEGGAREIQVKGFNRNVNVRPYPFLGPAFDYAVKIKVLEDAITAALNKLLGAK